MTLTLLSSGVLSLQHLPCVHMYIAQAQSCVTPKPLLLQEWQSLGMSFCIVLLMSQFMLKPNRQTAVSQPGGFDQHTAATAFDF